MIDAPTNIDIASLWIRSSRLGAYVRPAADIRPPFMPVTTTPVYGNTSAIGIDLSGSATAANNNNTAIAGISFSPTGYLLARLDALERACRKDGIECPAAFADARQFIENSALGAVPLPRISVAEDGELNFHWDTNGIHIDLGFYGTGTFSYYAHDRQGRRFHGPPTPATQGLPQPLQAMFIS